MMDINKHIISEAATVRDVLRKLDKLASDAILFLTNLDHQLIGSLTDGDIRRGLIKGLDLETPIKEFIQEDPKYFIKGQFSFSQMQEWKKKNFKIIPVLNEQREIIDIVNFRLQKSYLPIDSVIMAGGKGSRLMPLTKDTPKPLLKIGDKPIIEHNIDRLKDFGIRGITITINYLGEQLKTYFGDGNTKSLNIQYVEEDKPLGTIGAVRLADHFENDYILLMNSDLLTNINYEDLFKEMIEKEADMIVSTIPYEVTVPYGVIESKGEQITALKEKPTYTYYSNAGIYIFKKELIEKIPFNEHYNATDLMEVLIKEGRSVVQYPILGYWLDIGKHNDYEKAQKDIKHINF